MFFGWSAWSGRRRAGFGGGRPAAMAGAELLEARALLSAVHADDVCEEHDHDEPTVMTVGSSQVALFTDDMVAVRPDASSATAAAAAPSVGAPPFPLADTFELHSLEGADFVIYLDFDGHTTTGTNWNAAFNNNAAIVSPAYDADGNAAVFSAAEREFIQKVWQRVAEDFAPFNVDVTTEDPGVERLRKSGGGDTQWGMRVIQTGDDSWLQDDGVFAGGIAYLGSFQWDTDTPCFSFNGSGFTDLFGEMVAADTISHEVGHTLGLSHDGRTNPREEYYGGHGSPADPTSWAPIMGAYFADGSDNFLTQWSKGEYANASQTQDDLAVITDPLLNGAGWGYSGLSYLADLVGNEDFATPATESSRLVITNGLLGGQGVIERTGDIDSWYFDWAGGTFSIGVTPAERGANLDIQAELLDATGAVLATSNIASALDALFDPIVLAAARYYIRVRGVGKAANGADLGYSNYGSLGAYTIGNAPGVRDDAYEENDVRALAADPLGNGGKWANRPLSSINGPGIARDDDWYAINVTADFSRLIAQLEFVNAQGNLDLYVYDVRGGLIGVSNTTSSFEAIDVIVPSAGIYYLRVAPTGGARGNEYDLFWVDVPVATPEVTVEASSPSVTEDGGQSITYTFRRVGGGLGKPITVGFVVSGTARFGTDYTQTGANFFTTNSGSITIPAGSATASITINPTPDPGYEFDETVVLSVTEGSGYLPSQGAQASAIARIMNDDPLNHIPVANDDAATTTEDASVVIAVVGNDTDEDPSDVLRVLSVDTTGLLGTVQINPTGTVTYNPGAAFQGLLTGQTATETFTYVVTDDQGGNATATVTVTINGATDAPILGPDSGQVRSDRTLTGNVLANDADMDGNPLVVSAVNGVGGNVGQQVTLPSGAKVTVNANGSYTFDPAGAFNGLAAGQTAVVTFTYTASDGVGGTATATVTITVRNANDPPVAAADAVTVNERATAAGNVLTNDSDPDGNPLVVSAVNGAAGNVGQQVTLASGAKVTVNANGAYTYDPAGAFVRLRRGETATDTFTYTASDGNGGTATATVTVTISGGGGETDVVGFSGGKWWVAASNGTAFVTTVWAQWANITWDNLVQGDFNGDGRGDVAGRTGSAWYVGLSAGSSFATSATAWGSWNVAAGWRDVLVGDFDGDGRDDVAGRTNGGQWWIQRSTGSAFESRTFATWNEAANWRDVRALDIDGDGKTDLAGRASAAGVAGQWYVARSTGNGSQGLLFASWNEGANWRDVRVLDVNGDGKDDLAGRTSSGAWFVSRGTGAASTAATGAFASWNEGAGWRDVRVLDVDGDGRDDIAGRASAAGVAGQWYVARSLGTTSENRSFGAWVEADGWRDVVAGDFDGDGRDDIAGRKTNGAWTVLRSTGLTSPETKSFGTFDGSVTLTAVAAIDAGVPVGFGAVASRPAGGSAFPAVPPTAARDDDDLLSAFWSKADDELEAGLLSLV